MPNIKLTDQASYQAYFEDVATRHIDIKGFKWGDKDVIKNDNLSDMLESVLWVVPYEGARYSDLKSDNVHKIKQARVGFLVTGFGDKFADENVAVDFCEAVIEQIVAKIILDKAGRDVGGIWTMLITRLESFTTSPIQMTIGSTKYVGRELRLDFQDPVNLEYNPAKWT